MRRASEVTTAALAAQEHRRLAPGEAWPGGWRDLGHAAPGWGEFEPRAFGVLHKRRVPRERPGDLGGRPCLYPEAQRLVRALWAAAVAHMLDTTKPTRHRRTWERPKSGIRGVRYLMVPSRGGAYWAAELGLSARHIYRLLAQLAEVGILAEEGRFGGSVKKPWARRRRIWAVAHPVDIAKFWASKGPPEVFIQCALPGAQIRGERRSLRSSAGGECAGGKERPPTAPADDHPGAPRPPPRGLSDEELAFLEPDLRARIVANCQEQGER